MVTQRSSEVKAGRRLRQNEPCPDSTVRVPSRKARGRILWRYKNAAANGMLGFGAMVSLA